MKRILIVGMSENPGGIESFIYQYIKLLYTDFKFDFLVFSKKCAYINELEKLGCNIYFLSTPQFRQPIKYRAEINNFFKSKGELYDIVWFNSCDLTRANLLKYAKKHGIKKRIIHSHNSQIMDKNFKKNFYLIIHNIRRLVIKNIATDFWACSIDSAKFFYNKTIINSADFKIITNAVDIEKYSYNNLIREEERKRLNIENRLVIGHVGRFQSQKNHTFLIDIFAEIHRKDPNSILLLVGQGIEMDRIKEKVALNKLQESVIFLGVRDDINRLMQAMDVFLFPSLFEGLGIVLIEAQVSGLPCVASDHVIPKIVKTTNHFEFINLKDPITVWAEKVIEYGNLEINRRDSAITVSNGGYNIKEEVLKLKFLLSK